MYGKVVETYKKSFDFISFSRGFSLVELILTIGLMSIILAIAIPSYNNFINSRRIKFETDKLISILSLARNSALMKNRSVVVCNLEEVEWFEEIERQCDRYRGWEEKMIVFYEADKSTIEEIHEENILNILDIADDYFWYFVGATKRNYYLRFNANAMTDNQNGTFYLCKRDDPNAKHKVIINKSGRIRDEKATNKDNEKCSS